MKEKIYTHDYGDPDHEIILKRKDGDFDWIDPIQEVWIDNGTLFVDNGRGQYEYQINDIEDFNIREYNSEDIFDYQGGNL